MPSLPLSGLNLPGDKLNMADEEDSLPRVHADELVYERFRNRAQLTTFDCGNKGLNEFILNDDEVLAYEADMQASTWLIRNRSWEVVAYYSINPSQVHVTHVRRLPSIRPSYSDHYYTALQLGRLAVQKGWHGRGIGTNILSKVTLDAIESEIFRFRLLVLAAEPESIKFYTKAGFEFFEEKRNKDRDKPMMFRDLKYVGESLGLLPPTANYGPHKMDRH